VAEYDPKARRARPVSPDDEPAAVDALLGAVDEVRHAPPGNGDAPVGGPAAPADAGVPGHSTPGWPGEGEPLVEPAGPDTARALGLGVAIAAVVVGVVVVLLRRRRRAAGVPPAGPLSAP